MTLIVTSNSALARVVPPNLPLAPTQYDSVYQEQFNNVLRLYFNQLNKIVGQLMATTGAQPKIAGEHRDLLPVGHPLSNKEHNFSEGRTDFSDNIL